jgi:hypothetical protein
MTNDQQSSWMDSAILVHPTADLPWYTPLVPVRDPALMSSDPQCAAQISELGFNPNHMGMAFL